jgi:membrane fusion protein, multidrug efflux system
MAVTASVVLAFVLVSCGLKQEEAKEFSPRLTPAAVGVQTVEITAQPLTEEVVGTVRAKWRATLEAKWSGRIVEMPVVLGQKVQQGQKLARLEASEIAARLEQAEASFEQAERDWQRAAALFAQQSVTRAEYDAAQARQRTAKGALAEAKALMSYVEIAAPFEGVVTKKWADAGDLAIPGKPLLDIEDPTALQVEADVPETIVSQIKRGARLAVRVDAVRAVGEGVIAEIAPGADAVSRTFRVKLDLPPMREVMPGQFARLALPLGQGQVLRVPATAIVQRGQLEIVFTVANHRAQLRLVKTGKRVGDEIEILSGLEGGKSVVVRGADSLTDGQPVEIK